MEIDMAPAWAGCNLAVNGLFVIVFVIYAGWLLRRPWRREDRRQ